jgi:alpha-beta hydrolase superfamily lysophospholipase
MDINMTNNDYYEFETTNSNLKGLVVISHGMAEHIGRYSWLIEKLNADGYIVIAKDHRGHGKNILKGMTPGLFANNDGWTKVGDDLRNTLNFAIKKYPNLDCFLLGHSMGSWIALSLLDRKLNINGLIITGSSKLSRLQIYIQLMLIKFEIFFKGPMKTSQIIDNLTLRKFNNEYKPTKTPNDWISSDPNSVNDYTKDPLCGFMVTNSLWNDLCKGLIKIFHKNFYSSFNVNIPILIISGKNDAANSNGVLANKLHVFLSTIFNNVSIKLISDARHEVFTEINKESTYKLFLSFIRK